jgi:hypothetical protein
MDGSLFVDLLAVVRHASSPSSLTTALAISLDVNG